MDGSGSVMAPMLVDLAIENRIVRINQQLESDESFFVADMGQLIRQYQRWERNLPHVRPYYGNRYPSQTEERFSRC